MAAFDITGHKYIPFSFVRMQGKKFYSDIRTQAAWKLQSTTVSTVAVVQLPC